MVLQEEEGCTNKIKKIYAVDFLNFLQKDRLQNEKLFTVEQHHEKPAFSVGLAFMNYIYKNNDNDYSADKNLHIPIFLHRI